MLRVGIIGCGAISEFHLRAVQSRADCRIVACADINLDAARHRAEQFSIPRAFVDADALLCLDDLDLVAICAPPKWHAELLLQALKQGKHTLVEKPLAMNLFEADAAIEAAADTRCIVGVALMHRYQPVYHAVRELVQAGALGSLRLVRLCLGRNMYHDSRFSNSARTPRSWLVDCSIAGGGLMMSSSIHFLSVVSYILGDPAAMKVGGRVRLLHPAAYNCIEDDVDIHVKWENGVEFVHRESWLTDIPYRAEFIGEAGQVIVTGESFMKLSMQAQCRDSLPPPYDSLRGQGEVSSEQLQLLRPTQTLFSGLWADMVDSVRQQSQVARLPSLQHARNMQAIVTAAYSAEATRQVCSVDWLPIESCRTT